MANRWPRPSSSSSSSTASSSTVVGDNSSIAPISGAAQPSTTSRLSTRTADGDRNGDVQGGGLVCGLIGKFECTQPPTTTTTTHADVKVTVNSGRDSGNDIRRRLITTDGEDDDDDDDDGTRLSSPLAGGAPTAVQCIRAGAVLAEDDVCYECSDKMATTVKDGGSAGSAAVAVTTNECSRSSRNLKTDPGHPLVVVPPSLHRFTKRQRKTVVYSRLCLDGGSGMFDHQHHHHHHHHQSPPAEVLDPDTDHHQRIGRWRSEQCVAEAGGWPGRQAEVIRFPCVERLIELYANIIREKEAEMQRFMSSIVREGDKSRLDKSVLSSSTSSLPPTSTTTMTTGTTTTTATVLSGRLLGGDGDIRTTAPEAPASVSSEPSSYAAPSIIDLTPTPTVEHSSGSVVETREDNPESPASDEGWRSIQQSPYGSSDEEAERPLVECTVGVIHQQQQQHHHNQEEEQEDNMKHREKVTRSASSDSALGLDEDLSQQEQQHMMANVGKARRLTLGVSDIPLRSALLPVPEPSMLPTTTTDSLASLSGTTDQLPTVVRSKMILEAQLIELPVDSVDQQHHQHQQQQHQQLGCPPSTSASRRESAQSYISDTGEGVRYVRTPSVVVSDYSDDTMCGITLEEIEYFRRHRLRRGSADCESDISAASSCSNLNYCGSSISALDGCEYQCGLRTPERKVSDCSTCSTVSCDEDEGYSVVRAKLANLSPSAAPASSSSSSTNKGSSVAPAAGGTGPQSQETDVRICSKQQKVSSSPHRALKSFVHAQQQQQLRLLLLTHQAAFSALGRCKYT
ncbi:uncharacterized protein LOC125950682 [Anopheles darlingi]|uniref:uncharacterized protein LOC125950682 n=1 Tax=Anopheles darlingi TaxID=43151 RepID=UPI0021005EF1|nr:uncharacterized protein LOC125950682 [Anopheles darlingi]